MNGIERLRKAKEILVESAISQRTRLEAAGNELWSALFHAGDQWPPELRERAQSIQQRILADGTIAWTVQRMTAAEIEQTAAELLRLIADAEELQSSRRG